MSERYCERCYNTGELDCHCGGDLCICERNGTYPCPDCGSASGFICDEINDEIENEKEALKTANNTTD